MAARTSPPGRPARQARAALETRVADALHSAAIHLLRRVRREDERSGLGPARLSALSVIVFGGPLRLIDLARAEQVRAPTITRIAAALEQDGLIERVADERDARAVRIRATPRGQRLLQEGRGRRVARLAAELAPLTRKELETLERAAAILERIGRGQQSARE
jgi:DNA-binding MarR family transcriptional regulator